jgi:light-regulated signal transduction histidine kinase (bacteriophytochrome)
MRDYKILSADGGFQSLQEMGRYLGSTSEALKSGPDEDTVNLLKTMSHNIRGSLVSMVATLKLLNRGYYGKMDEDVANKIKELLSNATRLTEIYAQSGLDEDKQNWQMANQRKGGGESAPRLRPDH